MLITDLLLPEFDAEMARTRKTLERVPDDKPDYKPHPKSMPLAKLANHTAEMPVFLALMLDNAVIDLSLPRERPQPPASSAERLERFDAQVSAIRAKLAQTSDAAMQENFRLSAGEHAIFDGPRYSAVRMLFFNHMIHHRAQLGVYLRLNDCPVPSIYGPSADEAS
jgi:uncharacterized damage-inducible protein DinB